MEQAGALDPFHPHTGTFRSLANLFAIRIQHFVGAGGNQHWADAVVVSQTGRGVGVFAVLFVRQVDVNHGTDDVRRQHGIAGVQGVQYLVVREGIAAGGKQYRTAWLGQALVANMQQGGQAQAAAGGVASNHDITGILAFGQ